MQTLNLCLPAILCDGLEYQVSGYMYCPNLDSPIAGKVTPEDHSKEDFAGNYQKKRLSNLPKIIVSRTCIYIRVARSLFSVWGYFE